MNKRIPTSTPLDDLSRNNAHPWIGSWLREQPASLSFAWGIYLVLAFVVVLRLDRWEHQGAVIVAIVAISPFCEEVVFRGWAWEGLANIAGDAGAWMLTSIAFGLVHVIVLMPEEMNPVSLAGVALGAIYTVMGLVFGYARMKRGIALSIPVHGAFNAAFFALPVTLHQAGWMLFRSI